MIQIIYWNEIKYPNCPWSHKDTLPYSEDCLSRIITFLLNKRYRVMLQRIKDKTYVYINKGDFVR